MVSHNSYTVQPMLLLEHTVTDQVFSLSPQMADFIEGNYLHEQVEAIKEISDHITNLKRVGPGHGEYHFDKETLGD